MDEPTILDEKLYVKMTKWDWAWVWSKFILLWVFEILGTLGSVCTALVVTSMLLLMKDEVWPGFAFLAGLTVYVALRGGMTVQIAKLGIYFFKSDKEKFGVDWGNSLKSNRMP